IQVIKVVRELTGLGLKEAKDLVEAAPKAVLEKANKEAADKAKAKLEAEAPRSPSSDLRQPHRRYDGRAVHLCTPRPSCFSRAVPGVGGATEGGRLSEYAYCDQGRCPSPRPYRSSKPLTWPVRAGTLIAQRPSADAPDHRRSSE